MNLVPSTTGASEAVVEVIPELKGKLDGIAIRCPTVTGSVTDIAIKVKKDATPEAINKLYSEVARYHLKGVLEFSNEPLVSTDIIGDPHSCIVDGMCTKVLNKRFVKMLAWYDNEWGYSCRMVDMLSILI